MYKTEQEAFWAGKFGSEYIDRNKGNDLLSSNLNFFSNALRSASGLNSCIEFGANIGMNLMALKLLYPSQLQDGVEINSIAAEQLARIIPVERVHNCSILDFIPDQVWDLVLVKGVLIHINPDYLKNVYEKLIQSCGKYLLVCEYYNPTPVAIEYRGNSNKLFKRDFCKEILDLCPKMNLIDYGFVYRYSPSFPQDDITWFLMEKRV